VATFAIEVYCLANYLTEDVGWMSCLWLVAACMLIALMFVMQNCLQRGVM
jgi:hypothetical protein